MRRGEITIAEEMEGLVGGERMQFREEQVQFVRKKEEEEKHVLAALALFGEIIADRCQQTLKENQAANRVTDLATLKINEKNKIKELYRAISEIPATEKEKNVRKSQKVEEEWKAMEEISEAQSANRTDQLEALRSKMKSGNHNLPNGESEII